LTLAGSGHDSPDNLLRLFNDKIRARGVRGMVGLQRIFSMMDDDQSGSLTQREFFKACKDFKVGISEENVPALFKRFDANGDGTMAYDEFLAGVRGDMSQRRAAAVKQVFDHLANKCGGRFTVDYVKKVYDSSRHPDVIQGKRTADNVLVEFIETFEAHHNLDGSTSAVSWEEWLDYYQNVSAVEASDETFMTALQNVFGMSAAKGGAKADPRKGEQNYDDFWNQDKPKGPAK